jgi:hypothetical protein
MHVRLRGCANSLNMLLSWLVWLAQQLHIPCVLLSCHPSTSFPDPVKSLAVSFVNASFTGARISATLRVVGYRDTRPFLFCKLPQAGALSTLL